MINPTGTVVYSSRRVAEERARWDEDDRVQCTCVADHRLDGTQTRCLGSTRHPSGHCTQCRILDDRALTIATTTHS